MKFSVVDCEQRSKSWFAARAGRLTSSCADVVYMLEGRKKGSESIVRRDKRIELALEQETKQSLDDGGYRSAAMERGEEKEGDAVLAYERETGLLCRTVGFLSVDDLMVGASPDVVIGNFKGGAEIKCPKTATHLGYLRGKCLPGDYVAQVAHQLMVTGADWWDFVSFDDRMPEGPGRLFIHRVWAKDVDLQAHELAVRIFLGEVEREREEIRKLCGVAA